MSFEKRRNLILLSISEAMYVTSRQIKRKDYSYAERSIMSSAASARNATRRPLSSSNENLSLTIASLVLRSNIFWGYLDSQLDKRSFVCYIVDFVLFFIVFKWDRGALVWLPWFHLVFFTYCCEM